MPTRAAIRLESAPPGGGGAAAPSLRSEYNGQLESLYYLDAAGKPWKTSHLAKGQIIRLESTSSDELMTAWMANIISAP